MIDASVLRAAGETDHGTSTACRNCLQALLESDHRAALSPDLEDEWSRHASKPSRVWWTTLTAQDRIVALETCRDDELADKIRAALPLNQRRIAEKDLHLVVAALATDSTIISCDGRARGAFAAACGAVAQLQVLRWVNPVTDGATLIPWLRGEAEAPRHWNLDSSRESA